MYKKTRICPECNKELFYSCNSSYNLAKIRNAKCRSCSTIKYAKRAGNLEILLNNSLESYYWIGFILADGHISKNNRLRVTLAEKDKEHLSNLSKYLKVPYFLTKYGQYTLSAMDKVNLSILRDNFDISNQKTYIPPNIKVFKKLNNDQLLSLFVGFIDGDGSIRNYQNRKSFFLSIKCHNSWKSILELLSERFLNDSKVIINKQGYAFVSCGETTFLKSLKTKIESINLPIMQRKWAIINQNFIGKYEKSKENIKIVKECLEKGYSQKEISKITKLSKGGVSLLIKRNKL